MSCKCKGATAAAGYVMPIAYYPHVAGLGETTTAVMDLLVTHDLAAKTPLAFRFYPHDDGYASTLASTATFTTTGTLYEGTFLRIVHDGITGMLLLSRRRYEATWRTVSRVAVSPYICADASCFIFTQRTACALQGLCAIGFVVDDVPPVCIPETILPCKYAIVQDAPAGHADFIYAQYAVGMPTDWLQGAWQVLKWGRPWTWATYSSYDTVVTALEDSMAVLVTPAQLVAIAYKPYYADTSPTFPGEVVCVVTERVPPSTTVYLYCFGWEEDVPSIDQAPTYVWLTPDTFGIDAGTVVAFGGLGTTPNATYGRLDTVTPPNAGHPMTAFTFTDAAYTPIAAVYSCTYRGEKPRNLQPGVSMLSRPWPTCPAILALPSCKPICLWRQDAVSLNNLCPIRWLCQPLPAFRCCSDRRGCSCSCGAGTPPSMFTTTTPVLGGGCGTCHG